MIFDSGVGGLSLVEHIRNKIPTGVITYLADNALFPYGVLAEQQLVERVQQLICRMCECVAADLVVVGCNSASTLVLPELRKTLSIPVVGVVPAVKPAAALSDNKVIGLLATPGTVKRDYTDSLISDFADGCDIIRVGSSELVQLVEDKFRGVVHPMQTFKNILEPLSKPNGRKAPDTVVLACTHFPLAKKELCKAAPDIKYWVDSGEAIARQVQRLLTDRPPARFNTSDTAWFTQIDTVNHCLRNHLKNFGFERVMEWANHDT